MAEIDAKLRRQLKGSRSNTDLAKAFGVHRSTVARWRASLEDPPRTNPKTGRPVQAQKPKASTRAKLPAKLPRTKPYKGKLKARKADRRVKRNPATRVDRARALKSGGSQKVRMHATYDFYGSDARHRAVTFKLTADEGRKLDALIEGGAEVSDVADFLVHTKGAQYMSECEVYNVEEIKVM